MNDPVGWSFPHTSGSKTTKAQLPIFIPCQFSGCVFYVFEGFLFGGFATKSQHISGCVLLSPSWWVFQKGKPGVPFETNPGLLARHHKRRPSPSPRSPCTASPAPPPGSHRRRGLRAACVPSRAIRRRPLRLRSWLE